MDVLSHCLIDIYVFLLDFWLVRSGFSMFEQGEGVVKGVFGAGLGGRRGYFLFLGGKNGEYRRFCLQREFIWVDCKVFRGMSR